MPKEVISKDLLVFSGDADSPIDWADIDEKEEVQTSTGNKDLAAAALGRKGGAARAASMTPERRAEIARLAAAKRWAKR